MPADSISQEVRCSEAEMSDTMESMMNVDFFIFVLVGVYGKVMREAECLIASTCEG